MPYIVNFLFSFQINIFTISAVLSFISLMILNSDFKLFLTVTNILLAICLALNRVWVVKSLML